MHYLAADSIDYHAPILIYAGVCASEIGVVFLWCLQVELLFLKQMSTHSVFTNQSDCRDNIPSFL